jgi:surface protein
MTKEEILNLFKLEESMCKIRFEKLINKDLKRGKGTGFFCEIEDENFPIKYCLFTNNHVLDGETININKRINFEYFTGKDYEDKEIKITKDRKIFTNKDLDYTCIEIFKSDGINKYFKIEPLLYKSKDNDFLKDKDIFVLQYPNGKDMSFSFGKIKKIEKKKIAHNASTNKGSSGSPIIRRSQDNYVVGMHFGGKKQYNLAIKINSILEDISKDISKDCLKSNVITCIYMPKNNEKEINLIHDYNLPIEELWWPEEYKKSYLEAREINKKLFKDKIELYINDEKIEFNCKYTIKDSKEIKVKFVFKTNLINASYMFHEIFSLKLINLSSLDTSNVYDMSEMFSGCSSLESIDLSSINTSNVKNMRCMFRYCSSLKSIDLSSLNTSNAYDMSGMFSSCSSLNSIDLSSLNTKNVINMNGMFASCISL